MQNSLFGPLTLGAILDQLEAFDPERFIMLDVGHLEIGFDGIYSYRGYYEECAVCPAGPHDRFNINIKTAIERIKKHLGTKMHGYKGGEYMITEGCGLWLSSYGEASGWGISAIKKDDAGNALLCVEKYD